MSQYRPIAIYVLCFIFDFCCNVALLCSDSGGSRSASGSPSACPRRGHEIPEYREAAGKHLISSLCRYHACMSVPCRSASHPYDLQNQYPE